MMWPYQEYFLTFSTYPTVVYEIHKLKYPIFAENLSSGTSGRRIVT